MLGTKLSREELLHLHTGFLSVFFLSSISKCTAPVLSVCLAFRVSDDFVFLQAIGLSLRDLLAHVDEEIQRLDPSSHKEVRLQ